MVQIVPKIKWSFDFLSGFERPFENRTILPSFQMVSTKWWLELVRC
jgi:hypothetical protein